MGRARDSGLGARGLEALKSLSDAKSNSGSRVPDPGSRVNSGMIPPWPFVRWDPLQDLLAVQQRMTRLTTGPSGWTPPVDVFETADHYVVMVELPGLTQDDVQLQHHEGRA